MPTPIIARLARSTPFLAGALLAAVALASPARAEEWTKSFTVSGHPQVQVKTNDGAVDVRTGDGHIEAHDLDGKVEATSGDGRVRMDGRFDVLYIKTGDGSIDTRVNPGSKMASAWTIRTSDGSVDLVLPDGFAADVDAQTRD